MTNTDMQNQSFGVSAAPVQVEKKTRCVRTDIEIAQNRIVPIYAGKKVAHALQEVLHDMNVYKGVKLAQVLEAVYDQGKKDGARSVFESVDVLKHQISHRNPGHPKKIRRKK